MAWAAEKTTINTAQICKLPVDWASTPRGKGLTVWYVETAPTGDLKNLVLKQSGEGDFPSCRWSRGPLDQGGRCVGVR